MVYLAIYSPLWLCSGGRHPAFGESTSGVLPRAHEQHVQRHRLLLRQVCARALVVSPGRGPVHMHMCGPFSCGVAIGVRLCHPSPHCSDTSSFAVYRRCMLRLVSDLPLVAAQTFLHSLILYWIAGYTSADHGTSLTCGASRLCVSSGW